MVRIQEVSGFEGDRAKVCDAGIFKRGEEGQEAFMRFIDTLKGQAL